jgi:hypothetical protein
MQTRELLEEKTVLNELIKRTEVSFNKERLFASVRNSEGQMVIEKTFPNNKMGEKEAKSFLNQFKKAKDLESYFKNAVKKYSKTQEKKQ